MPKHKHADLIIAWANGATIQRLIKPLAMDEIWVDEDELLWTQDAQYRIKPERVWPVTSLTKKELSHMVVSELSLIDIANAAIKRYIEDNEK